MKLSQIPVRRWVQSALVVTLLLAGFGGMTGCKTVVDDPHHDHHDFHDDHHDHY